MKKKEFANYIGKPFEDIEKEILTFRERLAELRFDLLKGKVKNIREIREIKKTVARLLTLAKMKNRNTS